MAFETEFNGLKGEQLLIRIRTVGIVAEGAHTGGSRKMNIFSGHNLLIVTAEAKV
jgi:hypothetical protein